MPEHEYIDIVNERNEIVGTVSRQEIYAKRLRHRIVHILISDTEGRLGLQMRSAHCSYCPLHWCTSVGGHVKSGETVEEAALRECQEEIGVKVNLEFLAEDYYTAAGSPDKFLTTYRAMAPDTLQIDPQAIKSFHFLALEDIAQRITKGEKFHPELLFLFRKYLQPRLS